MRLCASLSFCAALSLVAGCSSGTGIDGAALTWYKDVKPLVDQHCMRCHTDGGIAPFSLDDYATAVEQAKAIRTDVAGRVMPPWKPGPGCTDYQGDFSLSDDEIKVFTDWVDHGAKEGNPADYVSKLVPLQGLTRVDRTLSLPAPYTPVLSPDEYRCFLVDWPETTTKFVTGFRAKPGDARIVHHVIAFLAPPAQVSQYQTLDANEAGPGWTCFGGPGGKGVPGWLGAWAPGSAGGDLPSGLGIRVEPGSKVVVQMHYNTSTQPPVPDQTSIELMLADTVDKEAAIMPWANPQWIINNTMTIPAGMSDVEHDFAFAPSAYMNRITNGVIPDNTPFTMWGAALHMHTRGTHAHTELQPVVGKPECLLDIPQWDFHWQMQYQFVQPKQVLPGDLLSLECHWNNSQGTTDLNWGEGTGDEMCLGVYLVTK